MRKHRSAAAPEHSPLVSPETYASLTANAKGLCYSYLLSREISRDHDDWYALLMALIRSADSDNLVKIEQAWPDCAAAFRELYWAPL